VGHAGATSPDSAESLGQVSEPARSRGSNLLLVCSRIATPATKYATGIDIQDRKQAPRHTHPGEEIIYVLKGTWEYTVEGKPPVTLKAGDVLFIPAGTIHSARNVGTVRAAELATYIVEKGKPLVVLSK
jgi:quercetin dioxygenase-like cupin family protein